MKLLLITSTVTLLACSRPCLPLPDASPDQAQTQIDCSCTATDALAQKACDLNCVGVPSTCVAGATEDGGVVYGCAAP